MLGLKKAADGEFSDPFDIIPLYIRKSEAEVKLQAKTAMSNEQ